MKKKRVKIKKIRLIGILVVIMIIIAFGIVLFSASGEVKLTKAMNTVSTYMSYINESKYDEMYAMLSENSKASVTKEEFITRNQTIYNEIEANNVSVYNMAEEEENGKIKITYTNKMETIAGTLIYANTIRLTKEER